MTCRRRRPTGDRRLCSPAPAIPLRSSSSSSARRSSRGPGSGSGGARRSRPPAATLAAPSLDKLEPYWDGYRDAGLIGVPPVPAKTSLPWNWKIHVENFTDAYHPPFVHRGTHDFAPSVHPDGGVTFTPMAAEDNAIVRSVPLLKPDGGMMRDGWGEAAMFPPLEILTAAQRRRLTFAMIPPSLTLGFAPGAG